jgi:hypothetical protein
MLEIYSVESRKGGVGKTTIALNLAKALARRKYDVLLIDCDITGTPITRAAWNSPFWKNHVVASFKGGPDEGVPFNLISFYKQFFLKGRNIENKVRVAHETIKGRIHLIGSDIYDENGSIIIDPRDLMDDLHSYWFLEMIKGIAYDYCKDSHSQKVAVVLDNSPGYVGIGKSIREWLTSDKDVKAKFVLVSSLDEQDIDSTISSAIDIRNMTGGDQWVGDYVKCIINKVPEELLAEGSGYKFHSFEDKTLNEVVKTLFPIGKKHYPQNIVIYDKSISGQFIEASLLPKAKEKMGGRTLESAFERMLKKTIQIEGSYKIYSDITYLSSSYHVMLRELSRYGYVRMSQILASEDFLPETFIKRLGDQITSLGSMAHPNPNVLALSKQDIRRQEIQELDRFLNKFQLYQYEKVFVSTLEGMFKKAGIERKDSSIFQIVNLGMMLRAFYAVQEASYEKGTDYRAFLKKGRNSLKKIKFKQTLVGKGKNFYLEEEFDTYSSRLLNTYFWDFYEALTYVLLRLIDVSSDYSLIVNACRDTIDRGAKAMSERLTAYLRRVVCKKTEDPEDIKYHQLVREPFEMKSIQRIISKYVLG